jgi:tRNA(His) 5'-end guanylyltransferase
MRAGERYHAARFPDGAWIVLRVDGRSFSRLTENNWVKPFDATFHGHMVNVATALLTDLQGVYAYTESDEISVVLPPSWTMFDREHEKVVSVAAGIASSAFSWVMGQMHLPPAHFDARAWVGDSLDAVVDYGAWRLADAERCALNGATYWALRHSGKTARQATRLMDRQSVAWKRGMLVELGIAFDALPSWQRRGVGLAWEQYQKEGYNPKTGETVQATRRGVKVMDALPSGAAYRAYLRELISWSLIAA